MVTPLSAVCKWKVRVEGSCLAAWPSEQSMNNPNISQCTWEAFESSLCLYYVFGASKHSRIFLQGKCRVKVVSPVNGRGMYSVYSASRCCILMSDCRTFYNPHHGIMTSSQQPAPCSTRDKQIADTEPVSSVSSNIWANMLDINAPNKAGYFILTLNSQMKL